MELKIEQIIEKQKDLNDSLTDFWKQDVWDVWEYIDKHKPDWNKKPNRFIKFKCDNEIFNTEIKYCLMYQIENNKYTSTSLANNQSAIHLIMNWLNEKHLDVKSIASKSIEYLETSLRTYLIENNKQASKVRKQKVIRDQKYVYREFVQEHPSIALIRVFHKLLTDVYDDRSVFEKDVWDLEKIGKKYYNGKNLRTISFTDIKPDWLKSILKKYCQYKMSNCEIPTVTQHLVAMRQFSKFICKEYQSIKPSEIDRQVILDFITYLNQKDIKNQTIGHRLMVLKEFIETNALEGWVEITSKPIVFNHDFPKRDKRKPRFIPQIVMEQLNQHLDSLPTESVRMILILQEVGMRIGELLTVSFDCLSQDNEGDWFLKTYMSKLKKEHMVPITEECANVILEQQKDVIEQYGEPTELLFPYYKGEPMSQTIFSKIINELAIDKKIVNENGKIFRFQAHQFRHTVGTRMINSGVPQHIVQRYLGHESPSMTSTYAHIHDQTLKKEFASFQGKLVDISGKVIDDVNSEDVTELQWLKKNILAQALPNGYCKLPVVQGGCPHANACLSCNNFCTDRSFLNEHKNQLEETEKILQVATKKGWQRQIDVNEQVKTNLIKIITGLEEGEENVANGS